MRSGGRTPGRPAGRARFPECGAAPSPASAAAAAGGPAGDRRGRFRPAPPPPLCHDHHGCRDRMPRPAGASRSCPTARRPPFSPGCANILVSRSCAGTASATYAEAVRRALPDAVQVSDRWHLWRNLCDKVQLEVRAHAGCWATINPPRPGGVREQTTLERWNKIHDLIGHGVGLLDCSRRLNLALNTVKRYARMPEPQALRIAPRLPAHPRRPLPRAPASAPCRGTRRPGHSPPRRDPGAGIHRQCQPAGPLPQPGPRRRRPPRHHATSCQPPPAHRPRKPAPEGNDPAGEDRCGLPGDDRKRPHRRRQHPHQENHETDARTRRIRPPPPPHTPALTCTQRHHRLRPRAERLTVPGHPGLGSEVAPAVPVPPWIPPVLAAALFSKVALTCY